MDRRKNNIEEYLEFGKIPPQCVEIEEAVLGGCMVEPDALELVFPFIQPQYFYKEQNQRIYEAIKTLYNKHSPVDILTVTEQLRQSGEIDVVGGAYYITALTNKNSGVYNIGEHSRIVMEKYFERELIRMSSETMRVAYEESEDVFDQIENLENKLLNVRECIASGSSTKHLSVILDKCETELKRRETFAKQGIIPGVPSGLHQLDKVTKGWQNGELIILASRPAMGKTASMLYFAKMAAKAGKSAAIYSLEMSDVSLGDRLILSECEIEIDKFKSGYLNDEDWEQFYGAKEILKQLPIYVDDKPIVTMNYIRANSKILKKRGKCDIIFADYLQLADMSMEEKGRNRENEVSAATRQAKLLAKELNVPFILLSQLNRSSDKEKGKDFRPVLSNLRESGAIEQDADIVIFVYRPDYYDIKGDDNVSLAGLGEYIIAKNRNGACRTIPFKHNESLTKIYDYDPSPNNTPF